MAGLSPCRSESTLDRTSSRWGMVACMSWVKVCGALTGAAAKVYSVSPVIGCAHPLSIRREEEEMSSRMIGRKTS